MTSALVTGGLGFIGSHLVDRLIAEGQVVHIVDDCRSNAVSPDHWRPSGKVRVEVNSIAKYARFFEMTGTLPPGFTHIYHLASPVGPAGILQYSGNMVKQIVDDTYSLMAIAQQCGARLLDVSTSEVYGGGVNGLCAEDMPRSIQADTTVRLEYAVAKLAAETAIINTARAGDLDAVIVRPFNVTGARQSSKGGFVLPRFIEQVLHGEPLTVFGDGSQVRAFTNVHDIVTGLQLAMQNGRRGEVYNLGNPRNQISVLDLANRVIEYHGRGSVVFTNGKAIYGERYAESPDKFPDAMKARVELDWMPQRSIDETIAEAYAYFKEVHEGVSIPVWTA